MLRRSRCLNCALVPGRCGWLAFFLAVLGWAQEPPGMGLSVPASGRPGFVRMATETTGIRFTNLVARERHLTNQIYLNGSGVAAGDVDGDGRTDLYLCGLDGPNALYRNLGQWRFEDVTARAGVAGADLDATAACLADLDGDGDLDLAVNSIGGGLRLLANDGRGHFTPMGPMLNPRHGGTSLALADIDGDGDLDLYAANYRQVTIRDQPNTRFSISTTSAVPRVNSIDGRPLTDPDLTNRFQFRISQQDGRGTFAYDEQGEADVLYRNEGGGRFVPVSWTGGQFADADGRPLAGPPFDWGLSAAFRDLNGDGAPDLYLCNDFASPDRVWFNDGRGRFRAAPALALRQTSLSSMGVDFADLNRDGWVDFLVVDMLSPEHRRRFTQRIDVKPESQPIGAIDNRPQSPRNTLFLNRGDGTWAEIAQMAGLDATDWSWTPVFLDVDLDGWEDLLVSNGFERDNMNMDVVLQLEQTKKTRQGLSTLDQLRLRTAFPRLDTPNLAYRNRGDLRFEDVSEAWGFHDRLISQGMCLADLDGDGDLDVIANNMNAPAALYRNESGAPRVAVRLRGLAPNTRGIGARITVRGGPVMQNQEMMAGGRYLSSDDPMRVFAAGSLTNVLSIEVLWRSGRRSLVEGVRPNRLIEIDEARAVEAPASVPSPTRAPQARALFEDVSARLNHQHQEAAFDDFARQPTLPYRLSQGGPGVTWGDADGDGWEDLLIASGRGGALALFQNEGAGGFRSRPGTFAATADRDQTSVLLWREGTSAPLLLVGQASDELAQDGSCVRAWPLSGEPLPEVFPSLGASAGPLAMADVDGDGRLDLFVGGRFVPGRWPDAASSALFRGQAGGFALDDENGRRLAAVGLVSGAVFTDLDLDGDPDLALACEWGPLKLFRNDQGRLQPWDIPVRFAQSKSDVLSSLTGLWTGLTAVDLDGDGRLDLVAGNWGANTRYERHRARPLHLFHGEFSTPGAWHAIEGYEEAGTGRLLPLQPYHLIGLALPEVRSRLGSFDAYARATLPEIHGASWAGRRELRAAWLESTVFLNRGDHLEARPLPVEAQFAPAFAVCAADFDGDGDEDVFLSQNFFALSVESSRCDAGRGLMLFGDNRAGLQPVPGQESGLLIYGEQRGAAVADFDGDGRADLAVAQNGAATKLYRNAGARPGLRVRLLGPPGNPSGVGALLRVGDGGSWGPAREIHAGAGYWSCDSPVTVLGSARRMDKIEVRWPGGRRVEYTIPADVKEVELSPDGALKVRNR